MAKKRKKNGGVFERLALSITKFSGSSPAFIIAFGIIIIWALSGPFFSFSNVWQLVINTGTTIITFLMVFLIQRAQNKDALAIQLKLNELIAATQGTSNRLVDVEDFSEQELEVLEKYYRKLASLVENEKDIHESHSIDEAQARHKRKAAK